MAQKKFYAVKAGRTTGIFTTWVACKKSIDGYSGAVYKSFLTKAEAERYLHGDAEVQPPVAEADAVVAYIDGSYEHAIKRYSYGVVLLLGDEKKTFSGYGEEPELAALRNVAGELKGAMVAIQWAKENQKKKITLYYDYMGIEMWATGQWKANLPFTQGYVAFTKQMRADVQIAFVKVKAHSGDRYNEEVDLLAKSALEK